MTLADPRPIASSDGPETDSERERSKPATGRVAGWLVTWIRGYQLVRSGRPTGCRFVPTCSEYAIEAIEARGVARGTGLAARRLFRCGPWGGLGFDPVPDGRDTCTHP